MRPGLAPAARERPAVGRAKAAPPGRLVMGTCRRMRGHGPIYAPDSPSSVRLDRTKAALWARSTCSRACGALGERSRRGAGAWTTHARTAARGGTSLARRASGSHGAHLSVPVALHHTRRQRTLSERGSGFYPFPWSRPPCQGMRAAALLIALCMGSASAFYLPGVAPHAYMPGEEVKLTVNSLSSVKTHLPYEYYKLAYCRPPKISTVPENLGQLLLGNEIQNSAFEVRARGAGVLTWRADRITCPPRRCRSGWTSRRSARCCARSI